MNVFGAPVSGSIVTLALLLAGCAGQTLPGSSGLIADPGYTAPSTCDAALSLIRLTMAEANVTDAQDRPVPGFAFLRVNRFLAGLGRRFQDGRASPAFEAWVDRLQALEIEGLQVELANLSNSDRRRLARATGSKGSERSAIIATAKRCGRRARQRHLASAPARRRLVRAARVADNYSDAAQFFGVYPVTSIPVNLGWQRWKADNLVSFDRSLSEQPTVGRLIEFLPSGTTPMLRRHQIRSLLQRARRAPLGIIEPRGADLQRLLHTFAPVWQLDVAGPFDRPGFPSWRRETAAVVVDSSRPVTFTRVSHAIVGGRIHLQLNYAIWFQKRPSTGPLDLLSGNLDGLVWRVTLDHDGRPLIYDSIHLCGCYHFLFPLTSRFTKQQAERNAALNEVPAVISGLAPPKHGHRIVLRLASGSHYLLGAETTDRQRQKLPRRRYRLVNEDTLRSLPSTRTQRKSLYRSDGLVAGTERLERFVLWPTGVVSPGAMRQWGHHAIAFADRRHFDDPGLFDTIFGH